ELIGKNHTEKKYMAIEHSSKLNVKSVKFHPGGSAANTTCNLSHIGLKTAFIGGVGNDVNGEVCLEDMEKHGVDVSGVSVFTEDTTAISVILLTPWGKDSSILAYKGANNLFSEDHIVEEILLSTKCFVWTSLTSDKGVNAIKKCIELTKSVDGLIAGAPSISIIKNRPEEAISLLRKCDITSMNEEELIALTNEQEVIKGMKKLFDWGLKIVNITFGKEGQWLSDGKIIIKTKPPKVFVEDTTGAGDATMSGIIYGFLENRTLQETAQIASALSAMEIESPGVRVGTPLEYSELEEFMKKNEVSQEISDF
ncbi:MAG: carbohydrate kinase family protein, partial [Candidatus Heimdallarchaeota archaeon]|nr:carbohydrate kinase family protein [Candidatus Heimdallarchaeota archaeon]